MLRLQPGERPETRRPADVRFEEARPRRGQLEQTQRVARRRRVEHDVIEVARRGLVAEQLRELVERGNLHRAGAGELLFDAPDGRVRKHAAVRPDHALAIGVRRGLGIDVQREEPRAPCDRPSAPNRGSSASTSSRFDAGSVLTSSTRRPRSASATAVAQATLVLPTPPLPVKKQVSRSALEEVHAAQRLQQQPVFDFASGAGPQQLAVAAGA